MSVWLFDHNQWVCRSAKAILDTAGKAAVIHPTGTGKNYMLSG